MGVYFCGQRGVINNLLCGNDKTYIETNAHGHKLTKAVLTSLLLHGPGPVL